jgi:hypothetical protein
LNAVNLPGVVGDSKKVPRQDLLDAVRERSPVYTHKEVMLRTEPHPDEWGRPTLGDDNAFWIHGQDASRQGLGLDGTPQPIGRGTPSGPARYDQYGQGGQDYTELLLTQPDSPGSFGNHWSNQPNAVAHARYDTHGDALRINELQSDLGIHNRKIREKIAPYIASGVPVGNRPAPFPLEDAWADMLIKRLALEAARGGHRAIEVASPRSIADKVGGNIDNYEHFYGKVIPGSLERLGRKMGGLTEGTANPRGGKPVAGTTADPDYARLMDEVSAYDSSYDPRIGRMSVIDLGEAIRSGIPGLAVREGERIRNSLRQLGKSESEINSAMVHLASVAPRRQDAMEDAWLYAGNFFTGDPPLPAPGRRYIMSDAMRRNILQNGIGAAIAAPIAASAMQDQ